MMKEEAVTLHGVPAERVVVTGAQPFDHWFDWKPSLTREQFLLDVGLPVDKPYILYLCSSRFIAPDEVSFVRKWLTHLRHSGPPALRDAGVVVRPHPQHADQWDGVNLSDELAPVRIWPRAAAAPADPGSRADYFDSIHYSAAVVGINTSAQLEAGILDRPVFTICAPEFAHAQGGTLHFHHLVQPDGGPVITAATLEEHVAQIAPAIAGQWRATAAHHEFIRSFIRPRGLDRPVVPVFALAIDELRQLPRLARRGDTPIAIVMRPAAYLLAHCARVLAEDRPLWVYAVRPLVTVAVWVAAVGYWARTAARERVRLAAKRMRRSVHRAWYESTRALAKRWKRAQGRARRALAAASSAQRRG
jgi:hypothetical protein